MDLYAKNQKLRPAYRYCAGPIAARLLCSFQRSGALYHLHHPSVNFLGSQHQKTAIQADVRLDYPLPSDSEFRRLCLA